MCYTRHKNLRVVRFFDLLLLCAGWIFFLPAIHCRYCLAGNPFPANELGKVLILEYHQIEQCESRWARSVENFKADLERLWESGYRPISMSDYLDGRIDLPSGRKPIILTFDDSSPGQFRYLVKNGGKEIDPSCAVGMLVEFHSRHPDFPLKAVFYVLPEAKQPHKLFGQPEFEREKLRELVRLGFEIGNHTLWHARLDKYGDAVVQKQLSLAQEAVRKSVQGYKMRSLALPLGVFPKNSPLALEGFYQGHAYHHEALLTVAGPPAPSPFSIDCDLKRLPRVQVPGVEFAYWLKYFERHPEEVFRSDGLPEEVSFPRALDSEYDRSKFPRLKVNSHRSASLISAQLNSLGRK